jgi:hypothetical protein
MKHILFVLLTVLFFSGCASQTAQYSLKNSSLSPAMQADVTRPLYCQGAKECKVMWKRALQFVNLNAGYPIKTANATLIETEQFTEPYLAGWREFNDTTALSMRVTKSPRGNGAYYYSPRPEYYITVYAWCDSSQGCIPNIWETIWRA